MIRGLNGPGFKEDEGFWEVGLHLFLFLLINIPIGLLLSHLATLAGVQQYASIVLGLLLGLALGEFIVARLRRRFRRAPAGRDASSPPAEDVVQPIYLVLPVALPIAVLWDYVTTQVFKIEPDAGFLTMFIGFPLAHMAFHRVRRLYHKEILVPEED